MDNSRKYIIAECDVCGEKYEQQQRVYSKAKWKNRCKIHRSEKHLSVCEDCGKSVWHKTVKRCLICSNKSRRLQERMCLDCGSQISRKAESRCIKCHNKKQDKGLSLERTKFNASRAWARARIKCFERDNWTCKECGKRGSIKINAHHIKGYRNNPESRITVSNLETLCEPCHRKHHKENGNGRRS